MLGDHALEAMFRPDMAAVPVFLMYTVCVTLPPGAIEPQLTLVKGMVQALSENTARLGDVVIVPLDVRFWVVVIAAMVDAVRPRAIIARAIGRNLVIFVLFTC